MADPNVTLSLFFTRWITHFCAPVFVLLAGVSAGLMVTRRTKGELGRLLVTRGIWLIAIEMCIVSTALTFAPRGIPELGGQTFIAMQVIWAIGASMLVLSAVQWAGRRTCLIAGLVIVGAHNQLDAWWPANALLEQRPLWVALHAQMSVTVGPLLLAFAYPVLPWIGVMLVGFGISPVFTLPADRRHRALLGAGLTLTAAFITIRALDMYGDPNRWQWQADGIRTLLDFINTTKYPPSLDFLLMTLGPAAILCAVADRMSGTVKQALVTLGRVPFAFYIAHFYLIHVLAVGLGMLQGFSVSQMATLFFFYPQGYGLPLSQVYVMWAVVVLAVYPFCRWMAGIKARRRDWWLSYV
jgi:uncharacterized membrane protein